MIESGELDLTFAVYPIPEGPYEAVELLADPYVLVVLENTLVAARDSLESARHCRFTTDRLQAEAWPSCHASRSARVTRESPCCRWKVIYPLDESPR
jgi:hypothetical protein